MVRILVRGSASLLLLVLACSVSRLNAQGQGNAIDSVLIQFPGFHLVTLQERDSDARAYIQRRFSKDNPSVVHADFDGDGNPDFAVLLKADKSTAAKLVVLLCAGNRPCKSVYELDETGYYGSVYLRPVAAGSRISQTDAIDTGDSTPPVRLSSAGVRITYFGKGEVVLYWDKKLKKIREIQTED